MFTTHCHDFHHQSQTDRAITRPRIPVRKQDIYRQVEVSVRGRQVWFPRRGYRGTNDSITGPRSNHKTTIHRGVRKHYCPPNIYYADV